MSWVEARRDDKVHPTVPTNFSVFVFRKEERKE